MMSKGWASDAFLVRGENTWLIAHAEELPDAQTGMPVKAPSDITTEEDMFKKCTKD